MRQRCEVLPPHAHMDAHGHRLDKKCQVRLLRACILICGRFRHLAATGRSHFEYNRSTGLI